MSTSRIEINHCYTMSLSQLTLTDVWGILNDEVKKEENLQIDRLGAVYLIILFG